MPRSHDLDRSRLPAMCGLVRVSLAGCLRRESAAALTLPLPRRHEAATAATARVVPHWPPAARIEGHRRRPPNMTAIVLPDVDKSTLEELRKRIPDLSEIELPNLPSMKKVSKTTDQ